MLLEKPRRSVGPRRVQPGGTRRQRRVLARSRWAGATRTAANIGSGSSALAKQPAVPCAGLQGRTGHPRASGGAHSSCRMAPPPSLGVLLTGKQAAVFLVQGMPRPGHVPARWGERLDSPLGPAVRVAELISEEVVSSPAENGLAVSERLAGVREASRRRVSHSPWRKTSARRSSSRSSTRDWPCVSATVRAVRGALGCTGSGSGAVPRPRPPLRPRRRPWRRGAATALSDTATRSSSRFVPSVLRIRGRRGVSASNDGIGSCACWHGCGLQRPKCVPVTVERGNKS